MHSPPPYEPKICRKSKIVSQLWDSDGIAYVSKSDADFA